MEGVRKLEPARIATAADGRAVRVERYWDVDFQPDEHSSEDELVERLRELLVEAVKLHQISDVPIGAFLSGGIDSSAVVATMAQLTSGRVKTFSIGFVEADYSELDHARRVAEQFGTEHHELILRPDVVQIAEDLAWYLDEPFGDTSAIPTYMVSKLASEHVTVVLTGDGGDELFAGLRQVRDGAARAAGTTGCRPRSGRPSVPSAASCPKGCRAGDFCSHLALDGSRRYLDASTLFRTDELRKLFRHEAFRQIATHDPWTHALIGARRRRVRLGGGAPVLRPPDVPAARHPHEGRSNDDGAFD